MRQIAQTKRSSNNLLRIASFRQQLINVRNSSLKLLNAWLRGETSDDVNVLPVFDRSEGHTGGGDGAVNDVWVEDAHVGGTRAGVGALLLRT